ncbi:hypothetical protein H4Q26_013318 [Puccinia striiformis f. sp. tritici PST-130]|nr:hypothetical protein H4Q26_013318 [Puccinia striiformis f. sp. tritici PST-130]
MMRLSELFSVGMLFFVQSAAVYCDVVCDGRVIYPGATHGLCGRTYEAGDEKRCPCSPIPCSPPLITCFARPSTIPIAAALAATMSPWVTTSSRFCGVAPKIILMIVLCQLHSDMFGISASRHIECNFITSIYSHIFHNQGNSQPHDCIRQIPLFFFHLEAPTSKARLLMMDQIFNENF